jgi:hypothetical protein
MAHLSEEVLEEVLVMLSLSSMRLTPQVSTPNREETVGLKFYLHYTEKREDNILLFPSQR